MQHSIELFNSLLSVIEGIDPSVRIGNTFGWPGVYVGDQLVACVLENNVAIKVPLAAADAALARGEVTRFRPFGMPTNREWVEMPSDRIDQRSLHSLLREAVSLGHARRQKRQAGNSRKLDAAA
jgi:TfoX/Sxy family transcriptional regulator of competence genes